MTGDQYVTPLALYSPLASWLLIALIVATVVLVLAPLWPDRSPRPDASVASSASRRDGDQQDHATFVFRPVEAKRRRLTMAQRRARRRSLQRATRLRGGAQ